MTWALFCHNFDIVAVNAATLPECAPYTCDAFVDHLTTASLYDYLWLLNDKETQYQGIMIEQHGSEIMSAIGSVSNVGESTAILDSCAGITGWRVRPTGPISNSSELRIADPAATDLLTNGFTWSSAIMPTGQFDTALFNFIYGYTSQTVHTVIVSVFITDADTVRVTVTATGHIVPYTIFITLPSTIVDLEPIMATVEYNRNWIKIWFGEDLVVTHIFTDGLAGPPQWLPLPDGTGTAPLLSMFKNSAYLLQFIALGGTLSAAELEARFLAFQRNFSTYTPPEQCT